jgi:hypothetical protein
MRRRLGLLALALGLAEAAVAPAFAQTDSGPAAAGFTQLFVSPCGEPYRGRPGDPYPVGLWFKTADMNHDGVIDREEFRADHAGFFDALDADENGMLEGPELAFYESRVVPDVLGPGSISLLTRPQGAPRRDGAQLILAQGGAFAQTPEGGHPGEPRGYNPGSAKGVPNDLGARQPRRRELLGAAAYGLLAEAEPVRAADTNLDGRISKAEFRAAADRRFKLLDKREDGKLTLDELPPTAWQVAEGKRR